MTAMTRACARREQLRRAGTPSLVPADKVRAQLAEWERQGIGAAAVARATGLHTSRISRIAAGVHPKVQAATEEIILSARPVAAYTDPTRSVRQIRALAVAGHSSPVVAKDCGTAKQHIVHIAAGNLEHITVALADRIDACYEARYAEDGGSKLVRDLALGKGWLPGDAWDDTTIGDPQALPWQHMSGYVDPVKVERFCDGDAAQLANREEIDAAFRLLHSRGWNDVQIGGRFDRSPDWAMKRRQALGLSANQVQARSKRGTLAVYLTRRVQRYRGRAGLRHPDELVQADARTSLADLAVAFAAAGLPWPADPRKPAAVPVAVEAVDLTDYDRPDVAA